MHGISDRRSLTLLIVVTVLVFMNGTAVGQAPDPRGSDTFDDVPLGHWADEAIGWAVADGITKGLGEGHFGLDGIVTRAQIMAFLYRTVNSVLGGSVGSRTLEGTLLISSDRISSDGSGNRELFGMNADGTNLQRLTRHTSVDGWASRSPDGTQIAFQSNRDGDFEIFVMDAAGTNVRQLTHNTVFDAGAVWSPDGTQIAFQSDRDGDFEIFVMDAAGTNVRQLTHNTVFDAGAVWSPDGTQIAFQSDRDGDFEVFVMDAAGANVQQLTDNTGSDGVPSWSPDGTQIAFQSDRNDDYEIFVMDAAGANVQQLTDNTGFDLRPCWSPDGTQIAFQSDRDGDVEIFVMDAAGANVQQLTHNDFYGDYISSEAWSSQPLSRGSDLFDDVPAGHWADEAIGWAVVNGIIDGGGHRFELDGTVSRAEIVTFLHRIVTFVHRMVGFLPDDPTVTGAEGTIVYQGVGGSDLFGDVPAEHNANRSIGWAAINGITSGIGQGRFDPDGTVTRAQIVTFLHRTVDLIESN